MRNYAFVFSPDGFLERASQPGGRHLSHHETLHRLGRFDWGCGGRGKGEAREGRGGEHRLHVSEAAVGAEP